MFQNAPSFPCLRILPRFSSDDPAYRHIREEEKHKSANFEKGHAVIEQEIVIMTVNLKPARMEIIPIISGQQEENKPYQKQSQSQEKTSDQDSSQMIPQNKLFLRVHNTLPSHVTNHTRQRQLTLPSYFFARFQIPLNLRHFLFDLPIRQKTVQKPSRAETDGQNNKDQQGDRQGNFPEENIHGHGRHILDNENNRQTGKDNEKDNLEIHFMTSREKGPLNLRAQ